MGTRSWKSSAFNVGDIVYVPATYFDDPKAKDGDRFSDCFPSGRITLLSGTVKKKCGSKIFVKVHYDDEICSVSITKIRMHVEDDDSIIGASDSSNEKDKNMSTAEDLIDATNIEESNFFIIVPEIY